MLLNSSQTERLIQALRDNFNDFDLDLRITRRLDPPQRLNDIIAGAIGRQEQLLALVEHFESKLQIEHLLIWAHEARPDVAMFQELQAELTPTPVGGANNDPFRDPITLSGDQPLVDRDDLRDKLCKLHTATRQVLVVNGERRSGRSYSLRLIYNGARKYQFVPIYVDLLRTKPAGDDLRPEHIGRDIALQMGFKREEIPPRQGEQDMAWNREFCSWLMGRLQAQTKDYWVVIDHSDLLVLLPGVEHFLFELTNRCDKNDRMRLVFLGFHKPDRLDSDLVLLQPVSMETIPKIKDEHIIKFFYTFYQRRQEQAGPAGTGEGMVPDINQQTAQSVKNVLVKVEELKVQEEGGSYMGHVKAAVEAEIKRINKEAGQ